MPIMKKKEMNEAERKYRLAQNYRHLAWRIMMFLKAHPDVLNANNNQEVYDAVREIQIQYHLKHTPKYTREDAAYFVDFMFELEAKRALQRCYKSYEKFRTTTELVVCTTPKRGFYRLPVNGCRSLTTHHYLRQPLQAVVFFCLLILDTRERVYIFTHCHLIMLVIFF